MATKKQVQELESRIRELESQLENQYIESISKDEAREFFKTLAPLAKTKDQVMTLVRIMSRI